MAIKKKKETPPEIFEEEEVTPNMFADEYESAGFIGDDTDEEESAGVGHNNPPPDENEADAGRNTLVVFADRIQSIRDEKKELAAMEKEVFAEAKAYGFDVKALRSALAALNADKTEREEFEDLRDFYIEILEARV